MAIDISRETDGLMTLPPEISNEIWANTLDQSVVQSRARRVSLPAGGLDIPMITGDPEADWVNETDEKPVSDSTFGSKIMRPYKLAVIEVFSDEFRRDFNGLYAELVRRLPEALGRKFDRAALGIEAAPGTGFDTLADAPTVQIDDSIEGYLSAMGLVATQKGNVDGWALSNLAALDALRIADGNGRPLLVQDYSTAGRVGQILGRPVSESSVFNEAEFDGVAGDWSNALWGTVQEIRVDISDQATVTKNGQPLNLWQRNMFALRAEVEVGFVVRDDQRFAKLVRDSGDGGGADSSETA